MLRAEEISKGDLNRRLVATSRSGVEEFGFISRKFENLGGSGQFKPNKVIAGVSRNTDGTFFITDRAAYFNKLEDFYNSNNNRLNPFTKGLINKHLDNHKSIPFSNLDGLPGMHAEVQSANEVFNFLVRNKGIDLNTYDLSKIQVSTYKLQGAVGNKFDACYNCSNIIPKPINIITGRTGG